MYRQYTRLMLDCTVAITRYAIAHHVFAPVLNNIKVLELPFTYSKTGNFQACRGGFETSTELLLPIIVRFHLLGTGIAGEPIPREYYSPNPSPIRSAARLDDTYT